MRLKPMTDQEYTKTKGLRCPFCESDNIEGGMMDRVEPDEAIQTGDCSRH